jgi:hypothetical protein
MDRRRRRVLSACGAVLGLAGCLGEPDGDAGTSTSSQTGTDPADRDTLSGTPPGGSTTSPQEPPDDVATPAGPRRTAWHVPTDLTPQRPLVEGGACYVGTGSYDEGSSAAAIIAIAPDGTVTWRHDTGQLLARVAAVEDGTLYAFSGDRTADGLHGQNYRVHAFDASSGAREWVWAPGKAYKFFTVLGVRDGTVFVGTHDDALQDSGESVSAVADGSARWAVDLGDVMDGTVVGDTVVAVDVAGAAGLAASDGQERWTFESGDYGEVEAESFGDLVLTGEETLHALDAVEGTERWTHGDGDVSTWVPRGDRVYVGGPSLVALDEQGATHWTYDRGGVPSGVITADGLVGFDEQALFVLERASGEERWRIDLGTEYPTPGGITGERLAYGARDGGVHAVDVATGESAWSWKSSQPLTDPVVADGRIVVGRDGGGVWALEP